MENKTLDLGPTSATCRWIAIACPNFTSHPRSRETFQSGNPIFNVLFFGFFQVFQSLFQLNNLTQMNQWNILHANQPSVPEATPAPGFERFVPAHRADQRVPTSTALGKGHNALVILYKRKKLKFRHTRSCCRSLSKAEKMPRLLRNLISFRFVFQLFKAFLRCLTWNT